MKELRKAKKVSSEQASTELEISRPTLSAYEQGKSFPDMLILSR
ncbi:MAG: helix-turn-helix domain-containing protein, partial [Oscillospiraceae bacterium]